METFDIIVIGSGPGGYPAAIRASQAGMKVAVVEAAELGGVCLNWGCIPTKALLKSAAVYRYARHAARYGVETGEVRPDLAKMVERSRGVAMQMSKGIEFLFKKNSIVLFSGRGTLSGPDRVEITAFDGTRQTVRGRNIIIATGSRPKELKGIPVDGSRIITSREALTLIAVPETLAVVGSGAIGVEFASFFSSIGSKVTVIEYFPNLVPAADPEISRQLERTFRKAGITTMTDSSLTAVDTSGEKCKLALSTKKGEQTVEADIVLMAAGISPNIENLGLEALGIATDKGKITVDEHYRTTVENIFAVGDVIETPALAHTATAEGIHCAEYIAGLDPATVNYRQIPSCIFTSPEISSVGLTESETEKLGIETRIGRFPYTASGKATADGERDGMAKLIFDRLTDELVGAHFIGMNVAEMITEPTLAMHLGAKAADIIRTVHPHPTMSESVMEAAAAAYGEAVHL